MPDLPAQRDRRRRRDLPLTFDWPTRPAWLYALTQGLHIERRAASAIPFLLAKLWSVIPRLFAWPPVALAGAGDRAARRSRCSSPARCSSSRRASLNAQYWYPFKFNFVVAHYYGAVVFVAALVLHVLVKLPVDARRVPRRAACCAPLRDDVAAHAARAAATPTGSCAAAPAPPTISRRGLLAFAGAGALTLLVGQRRPVDRRAAARELAFLAPRRDGAPATSRSTRRARGGRTSTRGDDRPGLPR